MFDLKVPIPIPILTIVTLLLMLRIFILNGCVMAKRMDLVVVLVLVDASSKPDQIKPIAGSIKRG
jgi:hypothetical protein